jgi:iron complex outermembrane receptor protein
MLEHVGEREMSCNGFDRQSLLVSTSVLGLLIAAPAAGQQAPTPPASTTDAPEQDTAQQEDIVVTGFRASLNNALNLKRQETAAIDSIVAEDIGKFPDSNLAESMQRIPGVALSRGDGGEGRNISVRGLGSQFTRVRINGMEGVSQVSGSDIRGGAGR